MNDNLLAEKDQRIARLEQALANERADKKRLREKLQRNKEQDILRKQFRTILTEDLTSTDKDLLEEFMHTETWGQVHDQLGRTRMNFRTIALKIGVSEDTVARRFTKRLIYSNLIKSAEKEEGSERWYISTDRDIIQAAAAAYSAAAKEAAETGEPIKNPGIITFTEPPAKHGGNRYICPCGSSNVEIRKVTRVYLHCLKCGKRRRVSVKDSGWIVQNGQNEQKQLAPSSEGQEQEEAGQEQLAGHTSSNPPVARQVADELTPDELEQVTAVALDNDDPNHIEMIAKAQKCTTIHRALTPIDIQAHTNGTKTIGMHLARQDGKARAFCKDADNGHDRALLREGARKLAVAGFFPLLDSAPENKPTGVARFHDISEHGWIVLDQAHDIEATWAEIHRIAPEWAEIGEQWPGSSKRVRWLGGRYNMPGFSEWSTLTSVVDGDIATNGVEAARLLLSHQTPATLIPPLPIAEKCTATKQETARAGGLLGKTSPCRNLALPHDGEDVLPAALAEFDAVTSWNAVFSPWSAPDRYEWYRAMRGATLENDASIKPNRDGRTYSDYGNTGEGVVSKDKLGWWCRVRGLDERAFKAQLCADYRARAAVVPPARSAVPSIAPYPPPPRESICCGSRAWQWTGERYVCGACHPLEAVA